MDKKKKIKELEDLKEIIKKRIDFMENELIDSRTYSEIQAYYNVLEDIYKLEGGKYYYIVTNDDIKGLSNEFKVLENEEYVRFSDNINLGKVYKDTCLKLGNTLITEENYKNLPEKSVFIIEKDKINLIIK